MTKTKSKQIISALLFIGTIISLYFVPWPIVTAWIMPLPNTVQEQVVKAADYGFDGIVVCVNKTGNQSELYSSGYKNRENKIPADPNALFKIASVSKLYNAVEIIFSSAISHTSPGASTVTSIFFFAAKELNAVNVSRANSARLNLTGCNSE